MRSEEKNIGFIIPPNTYLFSPWVYNYYFTELLRGAIASASLMEWNVVVCHKGMGGENDYVSVLENGNIKGLVLLSPILKEHELRRMRALKKPLIIINGKYPGISFVDSDNKEGAGRAVEYLIEMGHRDIGVINGPMSTVNASDRFEGYKLALESAGMEIDNDLVKYGDYSEDSGYLEMRNFLKKGRKPTAVFCANDLMAVGAMKAVHESGKKVPDDVSIVGFDDLIISAYITPALTTVRQPLFHLGKEAVISLISIIMEEKDRHQEIIVNTRLIKRDSACPPGSSGN